MGKVSVLEVQMASSSQKAPLDLARSREQLWLMKVPKRLMEHWQGLKQAGVSLGTVEPSQDAGTGQAYTFRLPEDANHAADMPQEYSMTLSSPPGGMYVISRPLESQKGQIQLEGRVVQKGEINLPAGRLSRQYRELVATRGEKAGMRREVQIVSDNDLRQIRHPTLLGKRPGSSKAERAPKRSTKETPINLPKDELETLLFEKFAEQQHWAKSALVDATNQSSAHLTQVLGQVAEQVRFGKHKGKYTLKAEYRER